jgi:hypothetical protein
MVTNAVNTELTPEFLETLAKEERTELLDYLNNYPFIRWMISPDRPYAKDLERDSEGKIIVNVVKPHILENMDYFRKPALAFKKHGKYTNLRPNGNPNSPYMKWLRKEVLKCWYGCKRPSDGEWITGYHYFYLNYSPIERATANIKDTNAVNRVVDFPDIYDGDYIFFHYINQARYGGMYNEYKGGQHSALIAARGKGKSFKVASMATRNFILGENKEVCEKVKSVVVASNTEYLRKDGTLNKILAMTDFLALNTQYPSSRLKSSNQEMHWIMGFKDTRNKDVALGTRNEIIGLSLNNDSDKARGKRSHLMIWEEFGMFPGFIDAWNTSRPNVEEGGYSFGQAIALGTGGTEGSDFSGALEMIYNPLGYNVYGVPNMFDKGTSGGSKSILFIGEYMNRKGCYDKNGNSDVIKAVLEEVKERVFIKYNSTDPSTIAQRIAEHPMSIQEAVMRRDGTLFPVADLTDHLNYIESNKIEWHRGHLVGELYQDPEGNISFRPTDDDPIRDFPLKDNRHKGALEIYELPKEVNGKVPSYRYVGGIDPIDDDHSTTVSLPSIFILDMFTDRIVAEYTGRPDFADDFYEICRRLAIFYNASLNYENDKKGLFTYFSNHHCTHLLCDTPDILRDVELVKSSMYGNKSKGTNSGKQVNAYARRLIRDWLLMPVKQTKVELDEHGDEVEKITTVKNLQRLRGIALIKELIMWNPDINADRVSALGMLMIIRENNMKYLPGEGTSIGKKARKNYLGNDPFFTSNFANNSFW